MSSQNFHRNQQQRVIGGLTVQDQDSAQEMSQEKRPNSMFKYQQIMHTNSIDDRHADDETGGGSAYGDEHAEEQTAELGAASDRMHQHMLNRQSDQEEFMYGEMDEQQNQRMMYGAQDTNYNQYHEEQQQLPSFSNLQSVPENVEYNGEDDVSNGVDYKPNRGIAAHMSLGTSLIHTQSQSVHGSKPESQRRMGDGLLSQPSHDKNTRMAAHHQSDEGSSINKSKGGGKRYQNQANETRISSMSPKKLAAQAAQTGKYGQKKSPTRDIAPSMQRELEKASQFVLTNQRPRNGVVSGVQTKTSETTNKYVDTVRSPNSNAGEDMQYEQTSPQRMNDSRKTMCAHATNSTLADCQMASVSDANLAFQSTNAGAGNHYSTGQQNMNGAQVRSHDDEADVYGMGGQQNTDMDELREYEAQMEQIQKLQRKLDSSHHIRLNENSECDSIANLNGSVLRPEIIIEQHQHHESNQVLRQHSSSDFSRQRVLRNLSAEYHDLTQHNQKLDRLINQQQRQGSIDSKKFDSQRMFAQSSQMEPKSSGVKNCDGLPEGEVTGDFRSRVTIQRSDRKSANSQFEGIRDDQNQLKTLQAYTNKSRGNSVQSGNSRRSSNKARSQKSRESLKRHATRSKMSRSHATGTIEHDNMRGKVDLQIDASPSNNSYHKQMQLRSATNADNNSHQMGIPSSIHSSQLGHQDEIVNIQEVQVVRDHGFFSEPTQAGTGNATEFSRQLQKLYDQLLMVYPRFGVETAEASENSNGRIMVPTGMEHNSSVYAIQLYNQLSFLYQRAKEHRMDSIQMKQSELEQIESKNSSEALAHDLQRTNDRLSREINNLQTKLNDEIECLQEQLQISELRERDARLKAQRQHELQSQQLQASERRFQDMKNVVERLEREKIELSNRVTTLTSEARSLRENGTGAGNVSFRGNSQELKRQQPASVQSAAQQKLLNELEETRSELHNVQMTVRELQAKLKAQEEFNGIEKQHATQYKSELNNLRLQAQRDEESHRNELLRLEDLVEQKRETIKTLNMQLEEFSNTVAFEFPLMIQSPAVYQIDGKNDNVSPVRSGSPRSYEIKLINQRNNFTKPKLITMTGNGEANNLKQQDSIHDIYAPFGCLSDEHTDNEDKNLNMPMRQKSASGLLSRKQSNAMGKKKKISQNNKVQNMFINSTQLVQSQIASAAVAEKIARELRDQKQKALSNVEEKLLQVERAQQNIDHFEKQKNEFALKQKQLSRENEELKVKFSQLLDQFQEYVNETERKVEEEQQVQKEMQEKLLSDLNQTIRELEEMSQNLQKEGQDKDVKIAEQHGELSRLQQALNASSETKQDEQNQQRMNTLTDEIECLKKQYVHEMDALRGENAQLRAQIEIVRSENQHRSPPNVSGISQRALDSNYPGINDQYPLNNLGRVRLSPHDADDMGNVRSKSHDRACSSMAPTNSSMMNGLGIHEDRPLRQAVIDTTQIRSRSGNSREQHSAYPQFNQTSGSLRGILVNSASKQRAESFERQNASYMNNHCERSTMVSPTRAGFSAPHQSAHLVDSLRRDIADKNQLIEQKNRDIVQMRLELDELRSNFMQNESLMITQQQRNRVLNDIDTVVKTLRCELERIKNNLQAAAGIASDNQRGAHGDHNGPQALNFHIIPTEQKLLTLLQEKMHSMHELASLTSDILLLTSKQKYMQTSSAARSVGADWRSADEGQLMRTVGRYENTLAQLDAILKVDQHDERDVMYDLKKLTENQTHQIVSLQAEIDHLKMNQPKGDLASENAVLKQEISMLREQAARSEFNGQRARSLDRHEHERKDATDYEHQELLARARNAEDKLRDREKLLAEARRSIKDKESQLEEVRSRVTVVAELFEKKPIKQRYSFEVLCDFVHDKAKRLFNKYENAVRDKKTTKDEQLQYYHRKVSQLDQEVDRHKECANLLRKQVVPRICALLKKPLPSSDREKSKDKGRQRSPPVATHDSDHISGYFVRQVLDDLEYTWRHNSQELTQAAQQSAGQKSKIRELQVLVERLSNQDGTVTQNLSRVTSAYNGAQAILMTPQTCNDQHGYASGTTPGGLNAFGGQSSYTGRAATTNGAQVPGMSEGRHASQEKRDAKHGALSAKEPNQNQVVMQVIDQAAAAELENMRDEKQKMNEKLDEFARMLREFQQNQQAQLDENSRLKEKIESLQKSNHVQYLNEASSDAAFTKHQHASFADENIAAQQASHSAYRDVAAAKAGALGVLNPMTVGSDASGLGQSSSGTNASQQPVSSSNRFVVARSYHINQGNGQGHSGQTSNGFHANSQIYGSSPMAASAFVSAPHSAYQASSQNKKHQGYSPNAGDGKDDVARQLCSSQKLLPGAQSVSSGAQGNTTGMHSIQGHQ